MCQKQALAVRLIPWLDKISPAKVHTSSKANHFIEYALQKYYVSWHLIWET